MKRLMALAAVGCLLWAWGCESTFDLQNPVAFERRITVLRSEAVGFRKEAGDYALLLEQSKKDLQSRQVRLDSMVQKKLELDKHIRSLEADKFRAKGEEAARIERTIELYKGRKQTATAQVASERVYITNIEDQTKAQEGLRQAFLRMAEQRERAALRLQRYAEELSRQ